MGLKGYTTSFGLAKWLERPLTDDSIIIKVLKHHGAIPFVRTNLTQLTLAYESSNPIYGKTLNAMKKDRTAGGSSTGNGPLIRRKGSPIGIGSDMGGSLRIPAHFNGIVALKPSLGRVSLRGNTELFPNRNINPPSFGPQGKDVKSVAQLMKALASAIMYQLDETIPPLPFNDSIYESKRKLRVGYFWDNGIFPCAPAIKRAVRETVNKLSNLRHDIIDCNDWRRNLRFVTAFELITDHSLIDGGKAMFDALDNEEVESFFGPVAFLSYLPKFVIRILSFTMSFMVLNQ